jgi:hypothetical protein
MTRGRKLGRWAGRRLARRLGKSVPILGAAVAVAYLAHSVRRKGLFGGLAHTALDALPIVGAVKNGIELFTDDWFPDRPPEAMSSPGIEGPPPRSTPGPRTRGA